MESITPGTRLSETKRRLLEALRKGETSSAQPHRRLIVRRSLSAPVPLSLAQEEIWRRSVDSAGKPPFYNESITIHRHGALDAHALVRSLTEILRRHEAWRTTFEMVDEQPRQCIHPAPDAFPMPSYDLAALSSTEKESEALRLAAELAQEPFDLKTGPLLRARLISLDAEHHRLHLTMHQIIVDGVSVFRVLPDELTKLYEAFSRGEATPLVEPVIQYGDFAIWQKECLPGEVLKQQLTYWKGRLSGTLPRPGWSSDAQQPLKRSFRGSILPWSWPKSLSDQLQALCQKESVTLFMALLAGFVLLCHYSTEREDIIVGTLAPAGRGYDGVQELLGCFLNPVPLRFRIPSEATFCDLLHQAREVVSGAVANDDVPFHRVAEYVGSDNDHDDSPFFDAVISLAPRLPDLPPGWDQTFMDVESGGSPWNLYLELNERPNGFMIRTQYNPDYIERPMVCRMLGDLQGLLEKAAAEPNKIGSKSRPG